MAMSLGSVHVLALSHRPLFMWKINTGQLEMQDNLTEAMAQSVRGLLCKHEPLSLMLKSPVWWHLQSQHQGDTDRQIWGIHWLASLAYGGSFRLVRGPASTNKRGTAVEDPPKLTMGFHMDTHTSVHTWIWTDVYAACKIHIKFLNLHIMKLLRLILVFIFPGQSIFDLCLLSVPCTLGSGTAFSSLLWLTIILQIMPLNVSHGMRWSKFKRVLHF